MDRKLVLNAQLPIAHGHRLDVTEHVDEVTGQSAVLTIVDLDTGVRYRRVEEPRGEIVRWRGRVLECTVTLGGAGAHTVLILDSEDDGEAGSGAEAALLGADAAAGAAKAEADRWGGGDRVPEPEPERFW